jgi:SulP family sulfate permease
MTFPSPASLLRHGLVAVVIGAMAVALNISGAAIIYQGPLTAFLDRAIAITLIGGMVMGVVSALLFSYRGTVCQPQNAVAVILSIAAGGIAAGMADPGSEHSFATVAALVATTTLLTGAVSWLLGSLRLGRIARFIPFPVLTGFLAASGYLLVMGALGMTLGQPVHIGNLGILFEAGNPVRWIPWACVALAITLLTRRLGKPIVFPAGLFLAGAAFYGVVELAGLGIDGARDAGLLLGPFGGEALLPALSRWEPLALDGPALLAQAPSVAAAVGLGLIGVVMSASSIEVRTGVEVDPDRDLRAAGVANLFAGLGGCPPGYHSISQTFLAHGLGVTGPATGWIVAVACLLAATVGTTMISALPIGIFAAGIAAVGLNLLVGPLIDQHRSMPVTDLAVVVIIPAVTAAFGFLWGVAIGLLAAALFFVLAFARVDVVRLATTGARLRSRLERPDAEQARLAVLGRQVSVYSLEGYIFFGTAYNLAQRVEAAIADPPPPRHILIDFRRVRGLDTSAAWALARLAPSCRSHGVALCFTGLGEAGERLIRGQLAAPDLAGTTFGPSFERELERVEELLLAGDDAAMPQAPALLEDLRHRHPAADLDAYFQTEDVPAGAEVIRQGATSDSLLVLRSGALRAEVSIEGGKPTTVARFLPGALLGEVGLYSGAPRTAGVVAEQPSTFSRIDAAALNRMATENPAVLADFHQLVAATLARRLGRTTALLADAEFLAD